MTESNQPPVKKQSIWKKIGIFVAMLAAVAIVAAIVVCLKAVKSEKGGFDAWIDAAKNLGQIASNPKAGFPGKDRVNILCMGIDDNWTNSDIVYTAGSRTDTLFMLSLDLDTKKVSMLSIPRDSFVPIAGHSYSTKINAAYSVGGPKCAEQTVANLLGVQPDYYLVLKIDGTKKIVDALGGVDVDVKNELNYDDNWGHLHVHLKPGHQHLNGDQAVGYARYRHGNRGVTTPEDGDDRRMERQHILARAMLEQVKSLGNLVKPNALIDTGMSCIETNLTRTQLFDIAFMFHKVSQDELLTAQLPFAPVDPSTKTHGAYVVELDKDKTALLTDWLLRGNDAAGRQATPVHVKNSTKVNGLAASFVAQIKAFGYTDAIIGKYDKPIIQKKTVIIDNGVANRRAAAEIALDLHLPSICIVNDPLKPNKFGWAPPASVTVVLGEDEAGGSVAASR